MSFMYVVSRIPYSKGDIVLFAARPQLSYYVRLTLEHVITPPMNCLLVIRVTRVLLWHYVLLFVNQGM